MKLSLWIHSGWICHLPSLSLGWQAYIKEKIIDPRQLERWKEIYGKNTWNRQIKISTKHVRLVRFRISTTPWPVSIAAGAWGAMSDSEDPSSSSVSVSVDFNLTLWAPFTAPITRFSKTNMEQKQTKHCFNFKLRNAGVSRSTGALKISAESEGKDDGFGVDGVTSGDECCSGVGDGVGGIGDGVGGIGDGVGGGVGGGGAGGGGGGDGSLCMAKSWHTVANCQWYLWKKPNLPAKTTIDNEDSGWKGLDLFKGTTSVSCQWSGIKASDCKLGNCPRCQTRNPRNHVHER